MIIQSFFVNSSGKRWRFVDSNSLDSDAERDQIQQFALAQIAVMQQDATCVALGISEVGVIGNVVFGVYDNGTLSGVMLVAALDYQSGPWVDLTDWEVVNNDPAVFHARPMPSFPLLSLEDALTLSVDAAHHLLFRRMTSVDGHSVEFDRLSWALFKNRMDANSTFVKNVHARAKADNRFSMTETIDPSDPERTLVDIGLA